MYVMVQCCRVWGVFRSGSKFWVIVFRIWLRMVCFFGFRALQLHVVCGLSLPVSFASLRTVGGEKVAFSILFN